MSAAGSVTVFPSSGGVRTVLVHAGRRGATGVAGATGPTGPAGESVTVRGVWSSGQSYSPNDAVEARSSASSGYTSMFVQYETAPEAPSTTEPYLDPGRWLEIGAVEVEALGNIYIVTQPAHGYDQIGTPLRYDSGSGLWLTAVATASNTLADGILREIVDTDTFLVQFSGVVKDIDPLVGLEPFNDGGLYILSNTAGKVTSSLNPVGFEQRIFRMINGAADAVLFPADDAQVIPPPTPAPTPATTVIRLDTIASWDGVTTTLPLTSGASPVPFAPSQSFFIYIDGNRQDPQVDYIVVDNGGDADIQFTEAPEDYVEMTGVYVAG